MKWEKCEYSGIKYSLIIEVQIKHFYRGIKTCKLLNCGQVFLPHSSLLPYSSCRSNPQRPATLPACLRKEEVRKSLLRTLLDDRQLAASLPQNRRRTIILPEQIWREVMVEWSPDSWMGLAGTTASLPWKCSLDKRTRFGPFVQNLQLICFCTVSSTGLEHIWLALTQKASMQRCVCVSVQEIPGRNMMTSSWFLPSIYKCHGESHRLTCSKISGLGRCLLVIDVISKWDVGRFVSCSEISHSHT